MLDFELKADALAVFVADQFEGDVPRGPGEVVAGAVEINGGEQFFAAADPEADMFFFEHVGAVHGGDGTGVKERSGVAHAAGLEEGEFFKVGVLQIGHVDAGVEFDPGNEVVRLQAAPGG